MSLRDAFLIREDIAYTGEPQQYDPEAIPGEDPDALDQGDANDVSDVPLRGAEGTSISLEHNEWQKVMELLRRNGMRDIADKVYQQMGQ